MCYFATVIYFIFVSWKLFTTVATSPYLNFVALLCQVKSLIVRFILDLDYCAETDFFAVTNLGKILCRKLRKLCQFT